MISIKLKEYKNVINSNKEYIQFNCPTCGSTDIAYMHMPKACCKCGSEYTQDLYALYNDIKERLKYHKEG
jgi:predicted RNA-binding Zn-ribbon protein involved in translation (DUF1610 family)